ncbi:ribonuclease H-like domain-containing protein, partial [Irpex rosettiformis]
MTDLAVVWTALQESQGRCWISSHSNTLLNHLRTCSRVPVEVQQRADHEINKHRHRSQALTTSRSLPSFTPAPPYSELASPALSSLPRAALLPQIQDAEATLQCDSWSGNNFHHYTGFTITIRSDVVFVALEDNSSERKTSDNLFAMIKEKLRYTEQHYHVRIVSFVSDSGGESKKARRLLASERHDLIVLPCYAHQVHIIYVLIHIQTRLKPGLAPLSVIRAVLTRWTSHFLAYRRLLQLQTSIMTLLELDEAAAESQLITGSAVAKAKATEIISHLKDDRFWAAIRRMKLHLEPFAYALNIMQSDKARLDTVLLILALLYNRFDNFPRTTNSDTIVSDTICNSINTRWEASDQDVFIAAVILNPTHKIRPFRKSSWFSVPLITILMCRLYSRFFEDVAPRELLEEVADYLHDKGIYSGMKLYQDMYMQPRKDGVLPMEPPQFWSLLSSSQGPLPTALSCVAMHLFSVCPNSASCERLFSLLKRTMTPARTQLTTRNLLNIAELHAHLR